MNQGTECFPGCPGFHPDAPSYATKPLDKLLAEHERKKKLEYVDRGTVMILELYHLVPLNIPIHIHIQ